MCRAPAGLVGLAGRKGAIAPGYDADLVVFNPEVSFTVESANLQHRHKITPYEGQTLYGKIETTILRGQKIYELGKVVATPSGQMILHGRDTG
jgi:allantoinase